MKGVCFKNPCWVSKTKYKPLSDTWPKFVDVTNRIHLYYAAYVRFFPQVVSPLAKRVDLKVVFASFLQVTS